jgi:hypothetical protein
MRNRASGRVFMEGTRQGVFARSICCPKQPPGKTPREAGSYKKLY